MSATEYLQCTDATELLFDFFLKKRQIVPAGAAGSLPQNGVEKSNVYEHFKTEFVPGSAAGSLPQNGVETGRQL